VSRRGPLGQAQYLEWWMSQCMSSRAVANVYVGIGCPAGLTPEAIDKAARSVLSRHESFRTTFGLDAAGLPEQLIHPVSDLPPIGYVISDSPDEHAWAIRETIRHEFDISAELPVRAIIIVSEVSQGNFLLICSPHIVCDYLSMQLIRAEILAVLEDLGSGKNPPLPDCGPQPLDLALEEALARGAGGEAAATRYWTEALSTAPLRNFWSSCDADTEMYKASAESYDAPVLLSRYALRVGSTPSIVYLTLVHVLISLISNRASTIVRFYFAGRRRRFENSVGPFHRELFSVTEISDSDTLSGCLRKVAAVIMRARARYSLDYLSFREVEIKEESRRGSAFAWGTVVNLIETPDFRSCWRELPDAPASAECAEPSYSVRSIGPDANERGLEVFLLTVLDPAAMTVTAEFNSADLRPEDAENLIRGPWDIIRDSLASGEDFTVADLRRRYGRTPAGPEAGCAPGLLDTQAVLDRFPGVTASFLAARPDRSPAGLTAYVAVDSHEITATDLRDHILAALRPSVALVCPDYFIICAAAPGDPASETSWRAVRRLGEGTGVAPRRLLGHTPQETTLLAAIGEVSGGESADLAKSYVEGGGTLLKVPAILRHLARAGFTGLRAKDFESHARLHQLARKLTPAPPAPLPRPGGRLAPPRRTAYPAPAGCLAPPRRSPRPAQAVASPRPRRR
jgi:hypothetical protein